MIAWFAHLYKPFVSHWFNSFSHPYEYELDRFIDRIKSLELKEVVPQPPKPIEDTSLLYVQNEDELKQMMEELRTAKEIAVDLEVSIRMFYYLISVSEFLI